MAITLRNSSSPALTSSSSSGGSSSSSQTVYAGGGEGILEELLKALAGGGTAEQRSQAAARREEIGTTRDIRADYRKEQAFADAAGAVSQQQRLALEQLIPAITRSAEGAGTSQSSMRALLLQDAANKAAESSAALGLKASTDYGQIAAGLSNTLEALTRPNDAVTDALLKALEISKGTKSQSSSEGSSSGTRGGLQSSGTRGGVQPFVNLGAMTGSGITQYGEALNNLWASSQDPVGGYRV